MANIILINDQDQEETLTGVSKLVTRSTDGDVEFSVGGSGGVEVDFGLEVGETYKTIYFNTIHDTAALDAALAGAAYPSTLTINGTAYPSNTLFAFDDSASGGGSVMPRLDIVDLTTVEPGAYAIWYVMSGTAYSAVYCTANVTLAAGTSVGKGWARKALSMNILGNECTLTSALDSFAGIKDMFFASSPQAYGSFLTKMSAPYITIVPTGGDVQFELNDSSKGVTGVEVDIRAYSDDQYTHEVATLLDGKLKVLALPDTTWEDDDGIIYVTSGWTYAEDTGLAGVAEWESLRENSTTAAKIKNVGAVALKFSYSWTAKYLSNSGMYRRGVSQVGGIVRQGDGTQGPYTLTQTLAAGESLIVAVTSGTVASGARPHVTDGRMTLTLTDFTEIT